MANVANYARIEIKYTKSLNYVLNQNIKTWQNASIVRNIRYKYSSNFCLMQQYKLLTVSHNHTVWLDYHDYGTQ